MDVVQRALLLASRDFEAAAAEAAGCDAIVSRDPKGFPRSPVQVLTPGISRCKFFAFRLGTRPPDEMDDHKMYYDVKDLTNSCAGHPCDPAHTLKINNPS